MALKSFYYERPTSLEQLKQVLASPTGSSPAFLAGGTDLLVAMRKGKDHPQLVVDLKGLPGLAGVRFAGPEKLWLGALTTIHCLETDEAVRQWATALAEGAGTLGSWQVRNRATVGGNLANGAPTADTAAPILALNAEILTWSPRGERRIPAGSFWLGAGKTSLQHGEIITALEVPLRKGSSSAYLKLGPRQAMDIAIAGAAVVLKADQGVIQEVRIALGGAGPTPLRARSAEEFLAGRPASTENISRAGELAANDSNPRTSNRASREYRLSVIPVLVERAIQSALQRQEALSGDKGGKV